MKKRYMAFAMALLLAAAVPAQAEESDDLLPPDQFPGEFSASMTFASDYIYRGLSQTSSDPAIQGSLDYSLDTGFYDVGWYAGMWGSNIDFDTVQTGAIEIDLYTGIAGNTLGVDWDVGFLQYWYPGSRPSLQFDFWEVYGVLGYDFDYFAVSGGLNYTPDFFGGTGDAIYYSADVEIPVYKSIYVSGHYGHQWIDGAGGFATSVTQVNGGEDYSDVGAAVGATILGFDWQLAFTDTIGATSNVPGSAISTDDERITGSVTASF